MAEDAAEVTQPQEEKARWPTHIKNLYGPVWKSVTNILGRGIDEEQPGFFTTRKEIAREMLGMKLESRTDKLTGLFNEDGFNEVLNGLLPALRKEQTESLIGYIDVNGLTEVNNSKGHEAGDDFIKKTAEIVAKNLRTSDLLARLHGDEFAFMLPGASIEQAQQALGKVIEALNQEGIQISVGIVTLDLDNSRESLNNADSAMYIAKQRSKSEGGSQMEIKTNTNQQKKAA